MSGVLEGKVAVIYGGGGSIGGGVARTFAREGARVFLAGRTRDTLDAVAKEITETIPVPTIGIGSGPDCDGQILVTNDLIGTFPWFTPRFVKPKLNVAEQMRSAVFEWMRSI